MPLWMWILVIVFVFCALLFAVVLFMGWMLADSVTKDYEQFKKDGH